MQIQIPKCIDAHLTLRIEGALQFGGNDINIQNTNMAQTPEGPSLSGAWVHRVIFTLQNGQVLEGSFADFQVLNYAENTKMALTMRYGTNLPFVKLQEIKSIRIE